MTLVELRFYLRRREDLMKERFIRIEASPTIYCDLLNQFPLDMVGRKPSIDGIELREVATPNRFVGIVCGWDRVERAINIVADMADEHPDAREMLRRILDYIEDGTLVRNTDDDLSPDWLQRMARFVVDLKLAFEAVKKGS